MGIDQAVFIWQIQAHAIDIGTLKGSKQRVQMMYWNVIVSGECGVQVLQTGRVVRSI